MKDALKRCPFCDSDAQLVALWGEGGDETEEGWSPDVSDFLAWARVTDGEYVVLVRCSEKKECGIQTRRFGEASGLIDAIEAAVIAWNTRRGIVP